MGALGIEDLLRRLAEGQMMTLDELSAEMAVDYDLLGLMLRDLERGGYLRSVELGCSHECPGCGHEGLCRLFHESRSWELTEKGRRVAGRHPAGGEHAPSRAEG